jgi:putative acetyltransferase
MIIFAIAATAYRQSWKIYSCEADLAFSDATNSLSSYPGCLMEDDIRLTHVEQGPKLQEIRALFLEYAQSLNFELCFQNFDKELNELPGVYRLPNGRLILCEVAGKAAGCIALKPLEQGACEMKRLFVRPEFRGRQLGAALAGRILQEARNTGYRVMRLDTIKGAMENAIALYTSLGFKETAPYYDNPISNAYFMELKL